MLGLQPNLHFAQLHIIKRSSENQFGVFRRPFADFGLSIRLFKS
ncbi:hypothetical protein NEIMUCOT_03564 [Neisseria mucosa ATCC 25996]|uniref:Uncharacterized protein n=1 Tax=Neisseria mucosa (strain ATCC 25996 / DSM 4631 / NCTC 10774 / M26) TaxID=546266 RepID=D2ZSI2_NEIM2|nr:hypothetical protein NEIMUCOT_03564 [Neisseria mucosa ATCC 25996]